MPLPRIRTLAAAAGPSLLAGTAQATVPTFTGIGQPGFVPTGSTSPFTVYPGVCASLVPAPGHQQFRVKGHVPFTPEPGWDVQPVSFDVAAWASASHLGSRIRLVDTWAMWLAGLAAVASVARRPARRG